MRRSSDSPANALRGWIATVATVAGIAATGLIVPASALSYGAAGWGEDRVGQLGDGANTTSDVPVPLQGLSGVVSIASGGKHGVALLSDGTAVGWGANVFGQLCNASPTKTNVPIQLGGVGDATQIAAGSSHTLVLLANGTVLACGENNFGQLGDGRMRNSSGSSVPVPVSGLSGVRAISASGDASLALLDDGTVMAWGFNSDGQLGDGNTVTSDVPVHVLGLSDVVAISAGHRHDLAILGDGAVMAWGQNNTGQLGDGTTTNAYTPVPVTGLSEVASISAGGDSSLALLQNGTVMSWGNNRFGQLGDGSTTSRDVPVRVRSLGQATAVSSGGGGFNLALLSGGTVIGWGANRFGQLGNGTITDSDVPVAVSGLSEVAGIATSENFSFAYGSVAPAIAAPSVTRTSPRKGPASGGTAVTITGVNLAGTTSVRFGATSAVSFKVTSPSSITAIAPSAAAGFATISVTTPAATTVTAGPERFRMTPTITKLASSSGSAAGGTRVTVTGSGFVPGASGTGFAFQTTKATSVNCSSSTTCVVLAPAHIAGRVTVLASVNGVSSPRTHLATFTYL
jgi:alpha-tubulin suppressor-like RCC1 family protein